MIPQIIPLTSDTPRLHQPVPRFQWHGATQTQFPPRPCEYERRVAARSAHTLEANMSHDTTNHPAHQRHAAFTPACSALPVARHHANALSTKAVRIPMALRHHERRVAARSAHTLEANISHDTANHPAHQRHAAFTPACSALPVARHHANALSTKAVRIPMALRHHERRVATRSAHTLEANISHDTTYHPAHSDTPRLHQPVSRFPVAQRHANALSTKAAQIPMALQHRKRNFATRSAHTLEADMRPPTIPLTSDTPGLHQRVLRSPVTQPHANTLPTKAARLPMALQHHERNLSTFCPYTTSASRETFSKIPPKVTLRGCKTSVSYETSSKSQAETPIGAHTSRSPAKQFRDSSQRLPRIFPCPHV